MFIYALAPTAAVLTVRVMPDRSLLSDLSPGTVRALIMMAFIWRIGIRSTYNTSRTQPHSFRGCT